jgi:hypothetical protein
MTTRLILLLAAALCWAAPLQGQTIKAVAFNTTNDTVVSTNRILFSRIGSISGSATDPSFAAISGTNTLGLFAASAVGIGVHLGFSYNGTRVFLISSNAIRAENPITFNNTTNAATTRTNLGLGSGLITNVLAGTNTLVFSNGILTGVNP